MTRWAIAIPPVEVDVDCDGARHRVAWRRGKLVLVDHDLRAEATLAALGGEESRCVAILHQWQAAMRGRDADELRSLRGAKQSPTSDASTLPRQLAELSDLVRVASWQRRWNDVSLSPAHRRAAADLLNSRLTEALTSSLAPARSTRPRQRIALRTQVAEAGSQGSVEGEVGVGRVDLELSLPLAWLLTVWGRGVGSVDGHLTLDVGVAGQDGRLGAVLLAWRPERATIVPVLRRAWLLRSESVWSVDHDSTSPPPSIAEPWWSVRVR